MKHQGIGFRIKKTVLMSAIVIGLVSWTITKDSLATGPQHPVQVKFVDVEKSADGSVSEEKAIDPSQSTIQIIPRGETVTGVTIQRFLYLEGDLFEVTFGKSFALNASTVLTDDADLPVDIPDGYYVEDVDVQVIQIGAELPKNVRASRYFHVENGNFYPISSWDYTEAVTEYVVELGPEGQWELNAQGGAMVSNDFQEKVEACEKSPESCAATIVSE
jgi:hypothetical protein